MSRGPCSTPLSLLIPSVSHGCHSWCCYTPPRSLVRIKGQFPSCQDLPSAEDTYLVQGLAPLSGAATAMTRWFRSLKAWLLSPQQKCCCLPASREASWGHYWDFVGAQLLPLLSFAPLSSLPGLDSNSTLAKLPALISVSVLGTCSMIDTENDFSPMWKTKVWGNDVGAVDGSWICGAS